MDIHDPIAISEYDARDLQHALTQGMVGRGKTSPPGILLFIEERDPGVDLGHFPELDALIEEAMGGILRKIEATFPAEARLTALLARTRQIPEEPS